MHKCQKLNVSIWWSEIECPYLYVRDISVWSDLSTANIACLYRLYNLNVST